VLSQKPVHILLSSLLYQKYKNLMHVLTGLIKFVLVDANMCVNFSMLKRSRPTPSVTNLQQAGIMSQGCPLERLLGYIETETGHEV
jgi:hypothetical protein